MTYHDYVTMISALFGTSGVLSAIYAFKKFKYETGNIIVKSAEGVVIMQAKFIDELKQQNTKLEGRIEKQDFEIERCSIEIRDLRTKLDDYEETMKELQELKSALEKYEKILATHGIQIDKLEHP